MIFEYSWQQFKLLNHIRILSESEQIRQYRFYLDGLSNQIHQQNKGQSRQLQAQESDTFLILQENFDFLLQENGDRLIWKL